MADLKRRIVAEFSAQNKARGVMAGFCRDMDVTGRALRRMAVGALALAGVGGFGYMLKRQMEVIDATAKLSDRLGMGTEALVGLQHGAEISGVETETLNKALSTLSSRLGEVDMGVGQARYSLDKLGLNYKDLMGLPMDKAVGVIADQIRNLSTQAEKAAAANYLFGRSGKQLLNLFEEGSKGIGEYRKEAEKLGLAFNRIDAAKVEAANDALTRTRAVFTGLFRQATIELAPYIEAAATAFNNWATSGEGVGANMVNIFETVALSIAAVTEEIENTIGKMKQLAHPGLLMEAETQAHKRYKAITGDTGAIPGTLHAFISGAKTIKHESIYEKILKQERAKVGLGAEDQSGKIRTIFEKIRKDAQERAAESIKRGPRPALELETENIVKVNDEQMKKVIQQTRDAIGSIRHMDYLTRMERIENLRAYAMENAATLYKVEEANRLLNDEIFRLESSRLDAMKVYMAEMKERLQEPYLTQMEAAAEFVKSTEQDFKSLWDPVIEGSKRANEAVNDFFRNLLIKFAQAQAQMAMQNIWDAAVGPLVTSLATAAFSGIGGAIAGAGKGAAAGAGSYGGTMGGGPTGGASRSIIAHSGGIAGITEFPKRMVSPDIFAEAPRLHNGLRSNEYPAILQKYEPVGERGFQEYLNKGNFNSGGIEGLLSQILKALERRQMLNATIVDKRDLVTRGIMESREGEKMVMHHVNRNS